MSESIKMENLNEVETQVDQVETKIETKVETKVETQEEKMKRFEDIINTIKIKVDIISDQYNELESNIYRLLKGMIDEVTDKTEQ